MTRTRHRRPAPSASRGCALRGQRFDGRYLVTDLIAVGGAARIYRAWDERLDRTVAVKLLDGSNPHSRAFATAFRREATTTARLWHPHIVAIFDCGEYRGNPYVVMEYVDGRSLRAILNEQGRLPVPVAVRLCRQLLAALAQAHRHGLVHRDVKPENILIDDQGNVKLIDFGLASPAHAPNGPSAPHEPLLATVAYVAPELLTRGACDPRTDVYATGIVLFELLTGEVPFDGPDSDQVAQQHIRHDVPAPSRVTPGIPSTLDNVVRQATARSPRGRPRDATALAALLKAAGGTSQRRREAVRGTPRAARRRLLRLLLVGVVLTTTVLLGLWAAEPPTRESSATDSARSQSSDG